MGIIVHILSSRNNYTMNDNEIIELKKFSKKDIVVKGNPLIQAQMDKLTTVEYKLLISCISKITPQDKVLDTIAFSAKDFCNLFNIQVAGMYTYLKKTCDKLLQRNITLETSKNKWVKFSWLHRIRYDEGTIMIDFHPDLEPYLLFCVENRSYTKYLLENIIDMHSKYSIRLYELSKQYQNITTRTFTITELKKLLGISNEYKKFNDFRKNVLLIAEKEINGLTDININIEEIKEGRKITKIKITILKKDYKINKTTDYKQIPKLKIISILKQKIYDLTGHIFQFKQLNIYHRIVLIELINKINCGTFNKVLIQSPNAFFTWHLEDINKMFDLKNLDDN
jgi:plasmid replication initiation protein